MVIPLLANQDLTPMLIGMLSFILLVFLVPDIVANENGSVMTVLFSFFP